MEDGDSIDVSPKLVGDIGEWGLYPENLSLGLAVLRGRSATAQDAAAILDTLHVVAFNPFVSQPDANIVTSAERLALMHHADEKHSGERDLKIELSFESLAELTGAETASALLKRFDAPVHRIVIRRVEASPEQHCISFHTDVSLRTMQVPLNDEKEYTGAKLVYLLPQGLQQPSRPAGSFTIHDNTIAHGVTQHTAGFAMAYSSFKSLQAPSRSQAADSTSQMWP